MSSEVLALKYRPKNFTELIGQDSIRTTLSLALDSSRLSHAYLFSGLRGSGKTSTARIFAKSLLCDKGPTSNPCEVCTNCVMASTSKHMDIIEMDAASSRKIDDIRDLIEHTKYKPSSARFKVFIIDEVHMLTKEAFNALLKTLEEPPPYVKFILATTDPLKLPATILSRTQHFRFKRISDTDVTSHLAHILNKENIEFESEALDILARSGGGSLRDTLTLLDQAIIYSKSILDASTVTNMLGLVDPDFLENLFTTIFAKDTNTLISYIKELDSYEASMIIDELIAFLKDKLYNNDKKYPILVIERFFRILSESKTLIFLNADNSFVLSIVFFKMIEALKIKDLDDMIHSLEDSVASSTSVKINTVPSIETPKATPIVSPQPKLEPVNVKPQVKTAAPSTKKIENIDKFEKLIIKIKDRDAKLAECFERSINFKKYEDSTIYWESEPSELCKDELRHGYSVINTFIKDIFGFETKIKKVIAEKKTQVVEEEKKNYDDDILVANIQSDFKEPQEISKSLNYSQDINTQEIQQSGSTIENVETADGSCVTGCSNNDLSVKEFNAKDILEEPMVKKAQELFEATNIKIQNKI